jgi:hypothetical protein
MANRYTGTIRRNDITTLLKKIDAGLIQIFYIGWSRKK